MKYSLKKLIALISASLSYEQAAYANIEENEATSNTMPQPVAASVINQKISLELAAHRSHSSHRSHQSHRSSSSGSGTVRTPSSSSSSTPPSKSSSKKADPLGQQVRPSKSYPSTTYKDNLSEVMKDKDQLKNIIMRMQLTLQFEGYYQGNVDGIMGPKTRKAVLDYKKEKGIPGTTIFDVATLNALGIKGY